jgi:hypothetical protein
MTKHMTGTREEWLAARIELHVSTRSASSSRTRNFRSLLEAACSETMSTTTVLQNTKSVSREEWLAALARADAASAEAPRPHRGADELEVQRRDICAQHASQTQQ